MSRHIRVHSDLHAEQFCGQPPAKLLAHRIAPDPRDADSILVLAGDISSHVDQLLGLLEEAERRFRHVVYVHGNHELYHHDMAGWAHEFVEGADARLTRTSYSTLGVQRSVVDGVRFVHGTLWADGGHDAREQEEVGRSLRDFYVIKVDDGHYGQRLYTVPDMRAIWKAQKARFDELLREPFDGPTVCVSHHLPSLRLVSERFRHSGINGGFASNCDDILASDHAPDIWIFGHTHDHIDTRLWKTRMLCNPSGYGSEWGNGFVGGGPVFVDAGSLHG